MSSFTCTVIGILGRDAELSFSKTNNMPILKFSVAHSQYDFKTNDSRTVWVDCILFGKRAESIQPQMLKSIMVAVTGKLKLEEYNQREKIVVKVNDVEILGRPTPVNPEKTTAKTVDNGQPGESKKEDGQDDCANAGQYCKHCILDVLYALDDRPRPA